MPASVLIGVAPSGQPLFPGEQTMPPSTMIGVAPSGQLPLLPGEQTMPFAVWIGLAPSGQPPPSQGRGVTLMVLLLNFEGEACTNVMAAPPKPLPLNAAASTHTS